MLIAGLHGQQRLGVLSRGILKPLCVRSIALLAGTVASGCRILVPDRLASRDCCRTLVPIALLVGTVVSGCRTLVRARVIGHSFVLVL